MLGRIKVNKLMFTIIWTIHEHSMLCYCKAQHFDQLAYNSYNIYWQIA